MLVRCNGNQKQNEAVRAFMRMRMRLAGLMDHTYWWQSAQSNKWMAHPERQWSFLQNQWKLAQPMFESLDARRTIVGDHEAEAWDRDVREYDFWAVDRWPTTDIQGKAAGGTKRFRAEDRWINRLIASIKKHGIKDYIFAWGHDPKKITTGFPPGTPNVILGSNRIEVAKFLEMPYVPVVISIDKGKKPRHKGVKIRPETIHNMHHRGDLWLTPDEWMPVHPPTRFYDEHDNFQYEFDEYPTGMSPEEIQAHKNGPPY